MNVAETSSAQSIPPEDVDNGQLTIEDWKLLPAPFGFEDHQGPHLSKPHCWCAPPHGSGYQCDGDADGKASGLPLNYRVFVGDLALIVENWKKKIDDATLNPCADIDHKDSGSPFKYRVFIKDLAILVTNWKKTDADLTGDCPR